MTITFDPRNAEHDAYKRLLRRYRPVKLRTPSGLLADAAPARSFSEAARDVLRLRTDATFNRGA